MPLTDPGDGVRPERSHDGEPIEAVGTSVQRPAIGALDGGVSRRLVSRCRSAGWILLVTGAMVVLVVVIAPWGVISALLTLVAATVISGSLVLLRRAALWSAVAGALLPASAGASQPPEAAPSVAAELTALPDPSALPGAVGIIGPTRQLSTGTASAPVKRHLPSAIVPIYVDDGPAPGGGALVVHARADGAVLTEGDTVLAWIAGSRGLTALPVSADVRPTGSPVSGRFVLYRKADGGVFLATTRLTDTW